MRRIRYSDSRLVSCAIFLASPWPALLAEGWAVSLRSINVYKLLTTNNDDVLVFRHVCVVREDPLVSGDRSVCLVMRRDER